VRLTPAVLARSTTWLLRPTERRSAGLIDLMAGDEPVDDVAVLVEWMTLVGRSTRTTGAPDPLPADRLRRWRGRDVRVLVGEHDVFFPPARLVHPVESHLGVPLEVVAHAGHLLVDQRPDAVSDALAGRRAG
jgi:pimeloyl-ACP methyl ester carboxylesterase